MASSNGVTLFFPSHSHHERKLKHLNKQKEGKKRLRAMSFGRVQIPQENFLQLFEQKKSS